jgi:hypothetical protein
VQCLGMADENQFGRHRESWALMVDAWPLHGSI